MKKEDNDIDIVLHTIEGELRYYWKFNKNGVSYGDYFSATDEMELSVIEDLVKDIYDSID